MEIGYIRNRRASTTLRTSSGISFGIAASTMTNRSQTPPQDALPLPLTLNFVPGLVFAGTFSVSRLPSRVSNGTSVQRRKSKNGTDRLMVTSSDSGGALRVLAFPEACADCPKGEPPGNPPPWNISAKSNVCDCLPCRAHEKPWKRSSNHEKPAFPPPENQEKPPASALPKVS